MAWVRAEVEVRGFLSVRFYGSTVIMGKSITVAPKKKRGRPPSGGRDPGVHVRLPEEMIESIDAYSAREALSRSEAIRQLVELGLTSTAGVRPKTESQRQHARDMAGEAIDKMADKAASSDKQASRKRQLVKGPEEFQKVRRDRNRK